MFSSPRPVLPHPRTRLVVLSLGFIALLSVFAFNAQAQQLSLPGLRAPEKIHSAQKEFSAEVRATRGEAPLNRLYDHVRVEQSKIRRLPALDPRVISEEKSEKKRRIGVVRTFLRPIKVSSDSTLYDLAEGDVRVIGLVSEGAIYTRIHFTGMSLPAGARVFVSSTKNPEEFYGPYEGRGPSGNGEFWTPPIEGDAVTIEYFTPTGASVSTDNPFQVAEVSHIYRSIFTSETSDNATAGSCNLEVTGEWSEVAKSVGHLQFTSIGGEYVCTGTLLNNAANDQTPYLLTANHCFNSQTEAQSLRVYWFYNTGDFPTASTPRTDGGNLLATGAACDFTLVRLTGTLPGGLFFSGWDASPTPLSTSVTGIHHPEGSHKRISFGSTISGCTGGLPGPCQNFTNVRWSNGTTEPGSSGSGIWAGTSSDSRLVGTLTGGYASCSNLSGADFYGSFSVTYQSIKSYLTAPSCVSAINPTSQNFTGSGGSGSISVTAESGCIWNASSSNSFVTITSGASGTGSGTVSFSVAPNPFWVGNPGTSRTTTITVGKHLFTITQEPGSISNCSVTPISPGQTINGTLANSDCQRNGGYYNDVYTFQGTAGQQLSISMSSSSFNTYLMLLSPNGSLLFSDDNGGGGTNARIPSGSGVITLPSTGTYTILATSFYSSIVGSYTLTVSDSPPPTIPPPTLSASISDVSVAEGNSDITFASFKLSLSASTTKSVCVQARTADGTAIAGTDYFAVGGGSTSTPLGPPPAMIFFDPGVTTATLTVQVRGDTLPEPDETFFVNINPCSTDLTVAKAQGVGTIINDDLLSPIKLVLDESGPEPNQAAAIDSLLFLRDLFPVVNTANFLNQVTDKNTRLIVFVTNLQLTQGEAPSSVIVNLIGSNNQSYDIAAEDVRLVPLFNFTQVRFRLPDNLAPGTSIIKVKARGQESNSGTIRIRN